MVRKALASFAPSGAGQSGPRPSHPCDTPQAIERSASFLKPIQVGVQTKSGGEAVVHTARRWTKTVCDDPDRVLVLIDHANAFNCVSRGAVLSAVREHFSWLAPWAATCYRFESNLLVGHSLIPSQRGAQHPLGPSLFALAIHPCRPDTPEISIATTPFSTMGSMQVRLPLSSCSCPPWGFFATSGGQSHATRLRWLPLAQQSRPSLLTTSRAAHGPAIGSQEWCDSLLDRRVREARLLLEAVGRCEDSQGGFALLRSCTGWAKILCSCRTVPPSLQAASLGKADRAPVTHWADSWVAPPVRRGLAAGQHRSCKWRHRSSHRIGTRPPPHTFQALAQSQELCARTEASDALKLSPISSSIYGSSTPSQKSLSAKIEAKACCHLLGQSSREHHRRGHFCLNRIPGAGAWLFALLDSLESHIPAPLFQVSLRRRLRTPNWSHDTNCTLCGQVVDKWGALVCGCGGDRVTRHNLVRDVGHSAANATILENPGLLIPRDPVDDDRPPDPDPPDPCRPADVWVRRYPAAAIASALRLGPSLPDPSALAGIFASVESRKNSFLDKASWRTQAGITFCHLVLEAVGGGWSDSLPSVVVKANDPILSVAPLPASKSRSASHAPFIWKTRARS